MSAGMNSGMHGFPGSPGFFPGGMRQRPGGGYGGLPQGMSKPAVQPPGFGQAQSFFPQQGMGVMSSKDLNLNTGLPFSMGTAQTGFMPTEQFMAQYGAQYGGGTPPGRADATSGGYGVMKQPQFNQPPVAPIPAGYQKSMPSDPVSMGMNPEGMAGAATFAPPAPAPASEPAAPLAPAPQELSVNRMLQNFIGPSYGETPGSARLTTRLPGSPSHMGKTQSTAPTPADKPGGSPGGNPPINYGQWGSVQDVFANNPFGMPAGFSWDQWMQANPGQKDPRTHTAAGEFLGNNYNFWGNRG